MIENGVVLGWAINICFGFLCAAIGCAFWRVAVGPSGADRVVALDLITILAVAICGLVAISSNRPAFLDVGVALALVAFLATVALARYIQRRNGEDAPRTTTETDP